MHSDILRLLKERSGFLSGEEISASLGITRAAVWKRISSLRKRGFVIEAVPSKGYRLLEVPDLSAEHILSQIREGFWKDVLFYDSLGSTNDTAMDLAVKGEIQPASVIIADTQHKGKGRLGRAWVSPPGLNIAMSLVVRPAIPPMEAGLLTILAAVSCASALRRVTGLPVAIKWPNDLLLSERKVGGILTETRSSPDSIDLAVIGIGINVNSERLDFPEEFREMVTSLREEAGKRLRRSDIVVSVLSEFAHFCGMLGESGRASLLEEWRRMSSTIGRRVMVVAAKETFTGLAEGIDEDGVLMVRLPGGVVRRVSAGDVIHVR